MYGVGDEGSDTEAAEELDVRPFSRDDETAVVVFDVPLGITVAPEEVENV